MLGPLHPDLFADPGALPRLRHVLRPGQPGAVALKGHVDEGRYPSVTEILIEGADNDFAIAEKVARNSYTTKRDQHARLRRCWPETVALLAERHRHVGDLVLAPDGIATRGMIVGHRVLPDGAAVTRPAMAFVASLSKELRVNATATFQPVPQLESRPRLVRVEVAEALAMRARKGA